MSYPLSPNSYWLIFGIFIPFYFPLQQGDVYLKVIGKMALYSFILWIRLCVICRFLLTLVLKHKGLILETRGQNPTFKTKMYKYFLEKLKVWNKPLFFSFQNALPRLSVPDLKVTIKKYLDSIRSFTDDENYERIKKEAETFENGLGKKIQRKLVFKSWKSENYVSDWWEEYHYLKSRAALMYGTSIYLTDNINQVTTSQSARAANLINLMLKFRDKILRQELEPIYLRNLLPICVAQYERLFNTARIPGIESDKIIHVEDSKHVVVMHKGSYYKLNVYYREHMLNAADLQYQIEEILQLKPTTSSTEKHLPSLTAWNRTKWAEVRDKFFSTGINKESLEAIESAAFIIALDDEPYIFDLKSSPEEYGHYGKQLLVGNGHNRWFDKSFNLCVGSNGRVGLLNEHTYGDGSVAAHFFEECLIDDYHCYDKEGKLKVKVENKSSLPKPEKLEWSLIDIDLIDAVEKAHEDVMNVVNNVDHQIKLHKSFGRGFMKKCKVSPDAFIQMAVQLAYYRQHQKFSLTYEPAMTRLFKKGRTETIRSCTIESSTWAKSMDNKNSIKEEKLKLFKKACEKHQQMYLDAMFGNGVDRHLFALQTAAKLNGSESNFLNEACNEPFMMLTSHIPHAQSPKSNHDNVKDFFITAGAAMPPGIHKGYSISYFPFDDELLFFHVSSMKNCNSTDTTKLLNGIFQALTDIKNLFVENEK
ncbi:hypothetical protein PVAND_014117 [Polypedilum vanderplanki]|uniref:Choline/carnitine acyltransferase domain-containing protein n=1 Tax=Polypedilum vanderplanki TaxID=319348 RepID=A0A9J6CTE4_POLVA|nr:hypothetical protein PVAND_014117 [Polypedilum vanderplanki]